MIQTLEEAPETGRVKINYNHPFPSVLFFALSDSASCAVTS